MATKQDLKAKALKELEEEQKQYQKQQEAKQSAAKANREEDLIGAKDAEKLNKTKSTGAVGTKQGLNDSMAKRLGAEKGLEIIENRKAEKAAEQEAKKKTEAFANKEADLPGYKPKQTISQEEMFRLLKLDTEEAEEELSEKRAEYTAAGGGIAGAVRSGMKLGNPQKTVVRDYEGLKAREEDIEKRERDIMLSSQLKKEVEQAEIIGNPEKMELGLKGYEKYLAGKEAAEKEKQSFFEQAVFAGFNAPDNALPTAGFQQAVKAHKEDTSEIEPNDSWSEEQKRIFGYYIYTGDLNKANEYALSVNNAIRAGEKEKALKETTKFGMNNKFLADVASVPGSMLRGAGFLDDLAQYMAQGYITENSMPLPGEMIDAYRGTRGEMLNIEHGTLGENAGILEGKGLGDLYQIGMSTADSLFAAYTGGKPGALVSAFGSSATSAVDDALARGATAEQAIGYGALSGAAELLPEYMSVDSLLKILPSGGLDMLANIGRQGLTEGAEGLITSLSSALADEAVMGELSKYNIEVNNLMLSGLSREEAEKIAQNSVNEEIILDTIGEALGGLGSGGFAVSIQNFTAGKKNAPVPFEGTAQPGTEAAMVADKITEIENRPISEADKAAKMEEVIEAVEEAGTEEGLYKEAAKSAEYHKKRAADFEEAVTVGKKLGITVEFDESLAANGVHTADGRIIINPNTENPVLQVLIHELTHDIETSGLYKQLSGNILSFVEEQGISLDSMRQMVKADYSEAGIKLSPEQTDAEIVAKFAERYLFTDERAIQRLCNTEPTLFEKIRYWISDMVIKLRGTAEENFLLEAERLYEKALATRGERTGAGVEQRSIVVLDNGTTYVEASRNVINSQTKDGMRNDITNFFNELLEGNNSIDINTLEGDVLTITKQDTANKARDDYKTVAGQRNLMDNAEFAVKINAEAHIDEIAETAIKNNKPLVADTKNHAFAKDGFEYRTAYFKDFNGQYYKIRISIGHNGNTATIYNVGQIEKSALPAAKVIAAVGSKAVGKTLNKNNISQNQLAVNGQKSVGRSFDELAEDSKGFKLKNNVEETKDLVAVHNLSEEKLNKSLDLGGLPMPSIAIIKAKEGHKDFGNISLVFNKETIDPKNKDNKVYSGDAWTPTYPAVEYKANENVSSKINEKYYELRNKFGYEDLRPMYRYADDMNDVLDRHGGEKGLLSDLYSDIGMMQVFLLDTTGKKVDNVQKEIRKEMTPEQIEWSENFINMLGGDTVGEVINKDKIPFAIHKKNYWEKYGDKIKKAFGEILKNEGKYNQDDIQYIVDNTTVMEYLNLIRDAAHYQKYGAVDIMMQDDITATNQAIREAVSDKDYRAWVDSLFKGIEEKTGIRNDKELFTPSGNRRSFEALHYENNLENVIKAMKKQGDKGVGEFGTGRIFGASTKDFSSIEDIKDAANRRLQNISAKEYESIKENFTSRFSDIAQSIPINKNSFEAFDDAANMLIEAVSKFKTKKSMADYIRRESQGWAYYSEDVVDDLVELVADIRNMPTTYFEAKPNRAVGFEEVAMAIIPNNINAETKERLENNGIPYIEYEAGNEESRKSVLNSLENVRFSVGRGFDELAGNARANHGIAEEFSAEITDSARRVIEQMPEKPKDQATAGQVNPESKSTKLADVPQSEKSKRIEKKYQRAVEEGVASVFGVSRSGLKGEIRPIIEEISAKLKAGEKIGKEQIENLYKTAFDAGIITEEFPQYDATRRYIRGTKIYIDQKTRDEFGEDFEFRDFARSNFGNMKFSSDPRDSHLDSFYKSLSEMEPDMFHEDETDPKTQLEEIADFMQQTKKQYYGLAEVYSGKDLSDFEIWAKGELQNYMNEFSKGIDTVRGYERDRQIKATNKAREIDREASFESAKAAFRNNRVFEAQKAMEKAKANALLKDADLIVVKRLHEGTLTEADVILQNAGNVEGIIEVYKAEKAYREARAPFDRYKAAYKTALQHDAVDLTELSDEWEDKKIGALYSRETAERNIRDIAGKGGEKIIAEYITPVHEHEAEKNRWIREMNQRVLDLDLGKMNRYERAYAQMIGENAAYISEGKITKHDQAEHDALNERISVLLSEHGNKINKAKCEKAAAGLMEIYEDIRNQWNDERIRRGQEPVGEIENYFPHFTETKPENLLQKIFSWFGIDISSSKLPTDIAGRTADRRPNTKYNPHANRRTSDVTDYDILKGFDGYVRAVGDNIFHTEDIQKLRALSDTIRTKYSSEETEKRIEEIRNRNDLSEEDKEVLIADTFKAMPGAYHLSNFVVWLDEYTNILAGKKSRGDREAEYQMGREIYDVSKAIEGRIASNMIGYNLSTPVMNLVPLFQATADISPVDIISSVLQTGVAAAKGDSYISDNSDFLTNRFGADTVYKKNYSLFTAENMKDAVAKINDGGAYFMEFVDRIVSEALLRARYQQNLKKGLDKVSAFSEADQWAAGLIADRSLGALPTVFNVKNPVAKALSMFQVEANNQYSYIFKDAGKYKWQDEGALNTITGQIAFWAAMALCNGLAKELLGRDNVVPDPVGLSAKSLGKIIKGEPVGDVALDAATTAVEQLPFVGGLLGGGRVPISTAIPDIEQAAKLFNPEVSFDKKKQILLDEISKPFSYILLPSGAGQLWKTGKGIKQIAEGGAFGMENDGSEYLKFPQEYDPENLVKTLLFGQYASDAGQNYIDSGFKDKLSVKQTQQMELAENLGISKEEFYNTVLGLKGIRKTEDKQEALYNNEDLSADVKAKLDYVLFGKPTYKATENGYIEPERNYTSAKEFYKSGLSETEKRLDAQGFSKTEIDKIEKAIKDGGSKSDDIKNIANALGISEQEAFEIYQKRNGNWITENSAEDEERAQKAEEFYGMSTERFNTVLNYSKNENAVSDIAKVLGIGEEEAKILLDRVTKYEYTKADLEEERIVQLETAGEWYDVDERGYFIARNAIKSAEGEKDRYGNTVSGSKKAEAIEEISRQLNVDEEEAKIYYLAANGDLALSRKDLSSAKQKDLEEALKHGWTERQFLDAVNIIKISGATRKSDIINALVSFGAPYEMAVGYYNLSENYDYFKRS